MILIRNETPDDYKTVEDIIRKAGEAAKLKLPGLAADRQEILAVEARAVGEYGVVEVPEPSLRGLLGFVQVAGAFPEGAGVGHATVEHGRVKRIAQVVMRVDVFLAVGLGVAVEQVRPHHGLVEIRGHLRHKQRVL